LTTKEPGVSTRWSACRLRDRFTDGDVAAIAINDLALGNRSSSSPVTLCETVELWMSIGFRESPAIQAALAARKKGSPFATADVTPDLIAPGPHVIALAQAAATDDEMVATVLSGVLARRGSKDPADVIQSLKTTELTAQYQISLEPP